MVTTKGTFDGLSIIATKQDGALSCERLRSDEALELERKLTDTMIGARGGEPSGSASTMSVLDRVSSRRSWISSRRKAVDRRRDESRSATNVALRKERDAQKGALATLGQQLESLETEAGRATIVHDRERDDSDTAHREARQTLGIVVTALHTGAKALLAAQGELKGSGADEELRALLTAAEGAMTRIDQLVADLFDPSDVLGLHAELGGSE